MKVCYSQDQSEIHILEALKDIQAGRFLDIGAWHPCVFSNTRALYELGWSGVMIEPSPEPFLSLLKEYGEDDRVELVLAAIGPERTLATLYATADATSTTDREHLHRWQNRVKYYGSFIVPMLTIDEILARFGAFDFVNIDVEGISARMFHDLIATQMFPRCICVEHDQHQAELKEAAAAVHYSVAYESGENLVFGRNW